MVRGSVQAVLTATVFLAPIGMLTAQDRSQDTKNSTVPEAAMPPAGMCRVWLRDVPERQQPAPTDCASAIRAMPRDAMVLFGDLKRAARVTPNTSTLPNPRQATQRELPSYRGSGIVAGDARAAQQQRGRGTGVTGVTATAPGAAAASKAPEKAPIKPEKPQ